MSPLYVFLGGGTGALLRWAVSLYLPSPWGTLLVNLVGCTLLAALLHPHAGLSDPARLALGTGLMGGLTTYSTFNQELLTSLLHGEWLRAGALALGTLVSGLGGGALGWGLSGWILAR